MIRRASPEGREIKYPVIRVGVSLVSNLRDKLFAANSLFALPVDILLERERYILPRVYLSTLAV